MRNALLLLLLLPLWSLGQNKTVVSVNRVFPRPDRMSEFEKALANHAQKYHTGTWKWRVFSIESGPDAGGFHVVEGPTTWDEVDKRGDLGKEHMEDWNKNVMSLASDRGTSSYSVFREDLSTIQQTDYTDKIAINHVFPKMGRAPAVEAILKNLKKVWEAGNQTIAVYESSSSGEPQFAIVTRYKNGLKERERNFRPAMSERYTAVYGAGSYEKYLGEIAANTDRSWSELLFYRADLSSK
jgi:hypothetical protein